jgi:hypothetical protein
MPAYSRNVNRYLFPQSPERQRIPHLTTGSITAGASRCAVSHARIRHIIGRSNNKEDLQTINRISITDYHYIDTIGRINRVMKKVIVQELEKVYPNAVNMMTDVIHTIYSMAEINCGVVNIKNDLKKGDKVQLIFEKHRDLFEVLEADANSFRVASDEHGKVFVFGKQVDDFLTVDYEALNTLNITLPSNWQKKMKRVKNRWQNRKKT